MEVDKFVNNLSKLLALDSINDSDVLRFVKTLVHLSKEVKTNGRFPTFGPIVKQWIGAYKTIFYDKELDEPVIKCIRRSGKILTEVFLSLMQTFNRHEPNHFNLEFYCQWKLIMSAVDVHKRARYVRLYSQQFKSLIESLRTATNRFNQLVILDVLLLYIEKVPVGELRGLKEKFNGYILDRLVVLKNTPKLVMNQHAFLHDIDGLGNCIISLKLTKIICDELSLGLTTSMYSLWIDFNMRENSIVLAAVSPKDNALALLATLTRPKLRERLSGDQELRIRGPWSIMKRGEATIRKRFKINVYLPIHDRNAIWKAKVKSIFNFVSDPTIFSQSMSSQDDESSMTIDPRLAQFAVNDRRYCTVPQYEDSFTSFSMSCSDILPITPIARMQLDDDTISLPETDRANQPATKTCVENVSGIEESVSEFDTILPIDQQSIDDPLADNLNERRSEDIIDQPRKGINDQDHLSDHSSDHSSGVSFGNDLSYVDYEEFENGMDENCGFRSGLQKHKSFSSSNSDLSDADEQVQRFLKETSPTSQEYSEQQPPNQQTDDNVSPDEMNKYFEDQTKRSLVEYNSSETRYSFQRYPIPSTSFRQTSTPTLIEHATENTREEISNFSDEMSSIAKIEVPEAHEPLADQDDTTVNLKSSKADSELTIDDEGMVFDEIGCVFVNDDEVEDALYVYIENNGLEYLKTEPFEAASPERRRRSEREFRAIQRMINGKFVDGKFAPNESIVYTSRGTAKRKSWSSSDQSSDSNGTDISSESEQRQPLKKYKKSESSSGNATNAGVSNDIADNGKSETPPSTLTDLTVVLNYLKDFLETREMCGFHRLQLLESMAKLQETNINSVVSDGKDILSATLANIRTICRQAKEYVSMILHETGNNKTSRHKHF